MIRKVGWLCVGMACLLLVGCGLLGGPKVAIDFHDPLSDKMSALKADGGSAPLNTLTDFGWDQVFLFHESASGDGMEKAVGEPVIKGKYYDSSASLLVFKHNGAVVRSIALTADYLRANGPNPFGPDVVVEPWGNGAMRLVTPGPQASLP